MCFLPQISPWTTFFFLICLFKTWLWHCIHSLHAAVAKELCVLLVCHLVLAADLQWPVSVISPLLTGREWELITVGPSKKNSVSCSHSSYSFKLSLGFKVFICDLMIFCINLLNQIVFGPCGEHWANEGCANQESIKKHFSTLPAWQEQAEIPVSIRTFPSFLLLGYLGELSSCCRYWKASLLLSKEILCLLDYFKNNTGQNSFF